MPCDAFPFPGLQNHELNEVPFAVPQVVIFYYSNKETEWKLAQHNSIGVQFLLCPSVLNIANQLPRLDMDIYKKITLQLVIFV